MNQDDRWKDGVDRDLDSLRADMATLKGDRKFTTGALWVIIWLLGVLSDKIKHLLGI